jgi:hypothetical protein
LHGRAGSETGASREWRIRRDSAALLLSILFVSRDGVCFDSWRSGQKTNVENNPTNNLRASATVLHETDNFLEGQRWKYALSTRAETVLLRERHTCRALWPSVQSFHVSLHGKIDPAIAKSLAEQIRAIGKTAKSEEDVRLNVEAALKHYLAQLGISTTASYEQHITLLQGSGSADAVYGFGIIEYKRPGVIAKPNGRNGLVEKLRNTLPGRPASLRLRNRLNRSRR